MAKGSGIIKGFKKGGKAIKTTGKVAADKVKTAAKASTKKMDDVLGVVDEAIDPKTGKAISKNTQRMKKIGKAAGKAADNAGTAYEGYTAVQDMLGGDTTNTDGGGGNPTGPARETKPTSKPLTQKERVEKPMRDKATPEVQDAAKNVLAEQGNEGAKPGRDEYMSALALVNRYEQYGCKKPSNKPNPVGPQKPSWSHF